jgi:hypothetical protein
MLQAPYSVLEEFIIMHNPLQDPATSAEVMTIPNLRCRQSPKYKQRVRSYYKKAELFPGSDDGHRESRIQHISMDDI